MAIKTVYDSYEGTHFGNLEANLRFLDQTGVLDRVGRVLEIGSGRGGMLDRLRRQGVRAVGVEPDATLAREARNLHPGVPLARMSGTALGFPDSTFDLVVSFDVFEHIADSDTHLAEIHRVLAPGGCLAFQTPNKWTNSVFETIRWRSFTAWKQDHCALHSLRQLERRLDRHGFDVELCRRAGRERLLSGKAAALPRSGGSPASADRQPRSLAAAAPNESLRRRPPP